MTHRLALRKIYVRDAHLLEVQNVLVLFNHCYDERKPWLEFRSLDDLEATQRTIEMPWANWVETRQLHLSGGLVTAGYGSFVK